MFNNANKKKSTRLSINQNEENLKRHPSVKSLFDDNGNKIIPSNDVVNNSNNYLYNIEIKNNTDNKQDFNHENIMIKIDKCDHKIVNTKETFYIEAENNVNNNSYNNVNINVNINKKIIKPLLYELDNTQKLIDEEITKEMAEGKDYKIIEQKFLSLLKRKNVN